MKNEAPYILEWVAHHKILGFDHIVVLTNDCSDGTNEILRRLEDLGYLSFRPNNVRAGGVHRSALRQARRLQVVQDAGWIYVTDVDEFLNIHVGNHRVDDLIDASGRDSDVIAVPWRIFSYGRKVILRNAPVTQQFFDAEHTYEDGGAGRRFVKSLVRNRPGIHRIGMHTPTLEPDPAPTFTWVAPGGQHRTTRPFGNHLPPPFGHDVAQVNHYAVRSAQSYLVKRDRGRANHMRQTLDTGYWERWNRGGAEDRSILRYSEELNALLKEMKSDRVLARLHARGFRWHKSKVEDLLTQDDYKSLYEKIAKSEPAICNVRDRRVYPLHPEPPEPVAALAEGA
jgi:hypothetical protein